MSLPPYEAIIPGHALTKSSYSATSESYQYHGVDHEDLFVDMEAGSGRSSFLMGVPYKPRFTWTRVVPLVLFAVAIISSVLSFMNGGRHHDHSMKAMVSVLDPQALNFLAVGDWGRHGGMSQTDVAVEMGKAASRLGTNAVISVGDNFYDNGVTSTTDSHWVDSWSGVYSHTSLQVPWLTVLGNHDYKGSVNAQLDFAKGNALWELPQRYYSVQRTSPSGVTAALIMMDTNPFVDEYWRKKKIRDNLREQQADPHQQVFWLESELRRLTSGGSRPDWIFVIGHHPVYTGGNHGNTDNLITMVVPLLEQYGVDGYFSGHDHTMQHIHRHGVDFFVNGSGSSASSRPGYVRGTKYASSEEGFLSISVTHSQAQFEFLAADGRSVYTTSKTK